MQTTNPQKKRRKNWKTWLLSALMVIALVGGGLATVARLIRPAAPFAKAQSSSAPTISLEPDFGPVSTSLQVEGQSWVPGSTVLIFLTPPGATGISGDPAATAQVNSAGRFTATVTIPADPQWQKGALATVYARMGQMTAQATFTLTNPPGQPTVISAEPTATPIVETPPSAVINSPTTAQFGQAITFDASASRSNSGRQIATYAWDFGDGTTGQGARVIHSYEAAGSYVVRLNVTDDYGLSSTATQTVQVAAVDWPVAIINSSATQAEPGQEINFSGSASHANPGHRLVNYHWDLGDGTTSDEESFSHIYNAEGNFKVVLTVTDDRGLGATANQTVQIAVLPPNVPERPPAAVIFGPTTAVAGQPFGFDASQSRAGGDYPLVSFHWDFGDGATGDGEDVSHTFNSSGNFPVTLTVTDSQGLSGSATQVVQVAAESDDSSLSADIEGPDRARVDQEVFLHAKASGDELHYAWNFDDGVTAEGKDVGHTYGHRGDHRVTLTVTDKHGHCHSVTHRIKID